jgi:hypothetical protein
LDWERLSTKNHFESFMLYRQMNDCETDRQSAGGWPIGAGLSIELFILTVVIVIAPEEWLETHY